MTDQPQRSSQKVSNSLSSPLQAPSISLPAGIPGTLRITFAPGKHGPAELSSAIHERALNLDLLSLEGQTVSQSGYVLDTLQAALALQKHAESWPEVAEAAALAGDDSDTVACVAGAIAGARGFDVPPDLLPGLRVGASWGDWQCECPSTCLAELL